MAGSQIDILYCLSPRAERSCLRRAARSEEIAREYQRQRAERRQPAERAASATGTGRNPRRRVRAGRRRPIRCPAQREESLVIDTFQLGVIRLLGMALHAEADQVIGMVQAALRARDDVMSMQKTFVRAVSLPSAFLAYPTISFAHLAA